MLLRGVDGGLESGSINKLTSLGSTARTKPDSTDELASGYRFFVFDLKGRIFYFLFIYF